MERRVRAQYTADYKAQAVSLAEIQDCPYAGSHAMISEFAPHRTKSDREVRTVKNHILTGEMP